jgi:hypothetical protein
MSKKIPVIYFLFLFILSTSVFAQQKTIVNDVGARQMLLGKHKLSLQWISWDYFGTATVTQKNGVLYLKGKQTGRQTEDYLTVDGTVTEISAKEFKFDGKIVTKISHNNGGQECVREGAMTFRITGKRKYWRLAEMDSPCEGITDYVDIYFR